MWHRLIESIAITAVMLVVVWWTVSLYERWKSASRRRMQREAWRAEQETARVFANGYRRMMDATFNYHWSRRNGGKW